MENRIGLFGTCGNSTWRQPFIEKYIDENIPFFNPQIGIGEWHPGMVKEENDNLRNNCILLFPITSETTAQGSLAELGFSVQAALAYNRNRYIITLIDDECKDPNATAREIATSNRSRELVKSKLIHLADNKNSGVFIVNDLNKMLDLSISLYVQIIQFKKLKLRFCVN